MSITPSSAVGDIATVANELRVQGVAPAREAQLEQQLVQDISGANPSANWGMIATITNDLADPTLSTSAVNVDVAALDRMVVPSSGSTLSQAIGDIAGQLRGQEPLPEGTTTLTATALANASAVTVPSTTGMFNGDKVQIQLDDGVTFSTTITTILNNTINLAKPLPSQASSTNELTNVTMQQRDAASSGSGAAKNIVTALTAFATAGSSTVQVKSAAGMFTGDPVQLQLSDGSVLQTTIASTTASTALVANAVANDTAVTVASTAGLAAGDAIQITLDNATVFNTTIASIAGGGVVNLAAPLPSSASISNNFSATISGISGSTSLTSDGLEGASSVTVGSAVGMANGDAVQIQLDNGQTFNTIIASIAGNTVNLAAPLPSKATTGASFTDPSNILVSLATPLPVAASAGGTLTDTAGSQTITNNNLITFSSPLSVGAPSGAITLSLTSAGGMAAGDTVQVLLDNGAVFNTTLSSVDSTNNTVTLAAPLPSAAMNPTATVTDMVSTAIAGSTFKATVTVSPEMQAMLQLQLNVLISAANSSADAQSLQSIEATLINSTLSTAQFQQYLNSLVETATQGLTPGTKLTFQA
jgi:hypothetical protein